MATRHTPKRNRPVPPEPEEIITTFDENAPIESDFGKPKPEPPPVNPPSTPQEPLPVVDMALPPSVTSGISGVISQLPVKLRKAANATLSDSIQQYLSRLVTEINAQNARDIAALTDDIKKRNDQAIREKLAEIAEKAGPTTPEEMQKVVSQEYLRFPLTVEVDTQDGRWIDVPFTIRELPQSFERTLTTMLVKEIVPLIPKLQSIKFSADEANIDKLQQAITVVPEILDIMSKCVHLCLNPFGKREGIDLAWVQQNVSTSRQMAILEAQMMANRMRDFFLAVSRVIPRT